MLCLEEVHSYYGDSHVVQGVSLTVERGETVALVGRNGAGKTTLLKTIMGIVPARRGRVLLDGADVTGLPTHQIARRGITLVPEDRRKQGLVTDASVARNVAAVIRRGLTHAGLLTNPGEAPDLLTIVRPMVRLIRDLPEYAGKTKQIGETALGF